MTAQDVKEIIMLELAEMYAKPFGVENDEAALKAYIEGLSDIPAESLSLGWRDIKFEHVAQSRPALGAIRKACLAHIHTEKPQAKTLTVEECMNTPQGQLALNEGWN